MECQTEGAKRAWTRFAACWRMSRKRHLERPEKRQESYSSGGEESFVVWEDHRRYLDDLFFRERDFIRRFVAINTESASFVSFSGSEFMVSPMAWFFLLHGHDAFAVYSQGQPRVQGFLGVSGTLWGISKKTEQESSKRMYVPPSTTISEIPFIFCWYLIYWRTQATWKRPNDRGPNHWGLYMM